MVSIMGPQFSLYGILVEGGGRRLGLLRGLLSEDHRMSFFRDLFGLAQA
jgi:hypothetical protein